MAAPTTDPRTTANIRSTNHDHETHLDLELQDHNTSKNTRGDARDKGNQPRQPADEEKREEKSKSNGGIARNHHESPPLRRRSSSLPRPYRNRMTKRKGTTPTPKFKQDKKQQCWDGRGYGLTQEKPNPTKKTNPNKQNASSKRPV